MRLTVQQVQNWQWQKASQLLPIVYLRGFALSDGEVDDTTSDPFNGFNVGSVMLRAGWTGSSTRHIFESPVLRLTQPPFNYRLTFSDGLRGLGNEAKADIKDWRDFLDSNPDPNTPPKAIIAICRYYDIDSHLLSDGHRVGMEAYGWGVGRLVIDLLEATGATGVYIVAHSMGGLVARTFLQNATVLQSPPTVKPADREERFSAIDALVDGDPTLTIAQPDWDRARQSVRRFFTYGTPHNGITGQGGRGNWLVGVAGALAGFEIDNFNRTNMMRYLNTPLANSLNNTFPVENTFCLVGTGSADYPVAGGFARRLVGQRSDGLVEVDNAVVCGPDASGGTVLAARAYVRRAHSGPYGMVNSEEGFGNLSRFLFGDVRIDGDLQIDKLKLPEALQKRIDATPAGQSLVINASYSFEIFLRVRGESWAMNERLAQDGAAIFRRFDEIFQDAALPEGMQLSPLQTRMRPLHSRIDLFTAFLDTSLRAKTDSVENVGGSMRSDAMGFALRLRVLVPDYEVDGKLWRDDHYEGSALVDCDLVFLAYPEGDGWGLAWGENHATGDNSKLQVVLPAATPDPQLGSTAYREDQADSIAFWIPIEEPAPCFKAWLRLTARRRPVMP